MPVYFAHGFRWPRAGFTGIRVHVIIHNLEDCSAEYIQNASSQAAILGSFRKAWPDVMRELDDESHGGRGRGLQLLEEYDPEDETSEYAVSRPWAFVCDCVKVLSTGKVKEVDTGRGASQGEEPGTGVDASVKSSAGPGGGKANGVEEPKAKPPASVVTGPGGGKGKETDEPQAKPATSVVKGPVLSMNITELIAQGPGSTPKAWEALADLRDKIAAGEKIDWWVIYNGDPERPFDDDSGYGEEEDSDIADEDGEKECEDQQPNAKTFVPRAEAIRPRSAPSPALYARAQAQAQAQAPQVPRSIPKPRGMSPPAVPPAAPPAKDKEGGKRTRGLRAFPSLDRLRSHPPAPPPAPVAKPAAKTEGGLKKKFFGKR
jgi:hypothetical protein